MKFLKFLSTAVFFTVVASCTKSERPPVLLIPALNPCDLDNVKICRNECELVMNSRLTAIRQEINDGLNLSNFSVSVCAGQFSPIYRCFLIEQKIEACTTLTEILKTENYKQVLENPNCQCNLLYT